jgi:hypothetical protein
MRLIMDRKLFGIGLLTVTAVVLFIAQFVPVRTAYAEAIKDRDYTLVTSRVQQGGQGLYIVENRTGMMAIFTWDPAARTVKVRAVRPIADAFAP